MSAYLPYGRGVLRAFYDARPPLYRDWLELYGDAAKPKIQAFLRCFGDSFHVPRGQFHKLGPGDGMMDYYRRDYSPGEPDGLEAETFVRRRNAHDGRAFRESKRTTPPIAPGPLTLPGRVVAPPPVMIPILERIVARQPIPSHSNGFVPEKIVPVTTKARAKARRKAKSIRSRRLG